MTRRLMRQDAGQIDPTDERIKQILCLMCRRLVWIEKGSRLDHEGMCDACSHRTDIVAGIIRVQ